MIFGKLANEFVDSCMRELEKNNNLERVKQDVITPCLGHIRSYFQRYIYIFYILIFLLVLFMIITMVTMIKVLRLLKTLQKLSLTQSIVVPK
jgi:hypothetical protein